MYPLAEAVLKASSGITKIVSTLDVDLLVTGEHGHKGFKDLVFETTVDSVKHKRKFPGYKKVFQQYYNQDKIKQLR